MSQFAPRSRYLRQRLSWTSFEAVDEFRQLQVLERSFLEIPRDWIEELLFAGARSMFPAEEQILGAEFQHGLVMTEAEIEVIARQVNKETRLHRERRRERGKARTRRLREDWTEAGGG